MSGEISLQLSSTHYYTVLSYDTVLSCFTNIDATTFIANYIEREDINLHFSVRITVQQLFEVSYQSNSDEIQCTKSYSREVTYSGKVWLGGKFGEFGKSSVIHQTKTIQIS